MKEKTSYESDLASIRTIMERSAKFISLSGLSGVMAGLYALLGAWAAKALLANPFAIGVRLHYDYTTDLILKMMVLAALVLLGSLLTAFILSHRKAKKLGLSIWNRTSRQLMIDLSLPLFAGGVFALLLVMKGYYFLVPPVCLIFYGLGLINASHTTYIEIRYLGIGQVILGLFGTLWPSQVLLIWSLGFGGLNIIYGLLMYFRYDK